MREIREMKTDHGVRSVIRGDGNRSGCTAKAPVPNSGKRV
jgi:hypothetical protein